MPMVAFQCLLWVPGADKIYGRDILESHYLAYLYAESLLLAQALVMCAQ